MEGFRRAGYKSKIIIFPIIPNVNINMFGNPIKIVQIQFEIFAEIWLKFLKSRTRFLSCGPLNQLCGIY